VSAALSCLLSYFSTARRKDVAGSASLTALRWPYASSTLAIATEAEAYAGEGHPMTTSEKLQVVVAALLGVFGIVMIAGVSIQFFEGTSKYSMVTDVLLTILLGILPLGYGVWLYRRVRQAVTRRTVDDSEKIVLRLAQRRQGVLTVAEVAANSTLSVEQAKETLDQLNLKGFNEMDVSDAGILVYKFHFKTR
jgi:hypothetical protein